MTKQDSEIEKIRLIEKVDEFIKKVPEYQALPNTGFLFGTKYLDRNFSSLDKTFPNGVRVTEAANSLIENIPPKDDMQLPTHSPKLVGPILDLANRFYYDKDEFKRPKNTLVEIGLTVFTALQIQDAYISVRKQQYPGLYMNSENNLYDDLVDLSERVYKKTFSVQSD